MKLIFGLHNTWLVFLCTLVATSACSFKSKIDAQPDPIPAIPQGEVAKQSQPTLNRPGLHTESTPANADVGTDPIAVEMKDTSTQTEVDQQEVRRLLLNDIKKGVTLKHVTPPQSPQVRNDSVASFMEDIDSIGLIQEDGIKRYDETHNHAFSKIFGGTTAKDVKTYFKDRIHFLLLPADSVKINGVEDRVFMGFANAENDGLGYFYQGAAFGKPVSVSINNEPEFEINSSRIGIMRIGFGYGFKAFGSGLEDNREIRLATLLHEARHSDCTGGIGEAAAEHLRTNNGHTLAGFSELTQCGHPHVKCPVGHSMAGEYACDNHAYGPYTVGAVFLDAMKENYPKDSKKWLKLKSSADDYKSRVIWDDLDHILMSDDSYPDMGSIDPIQVDH